MKNYDEILKICEDFTKKKFINSRISHANPTTHVFVIYMITKEKSEEYVSKFTFDNEIDYPKWLLAHILCELYGMNELILEADKRKEFATNQRQRKINGLKDFMKKHKEEVSP